MKIYRIILSLAVLVLSAQSLRAESTSKGRVSLQSDQSYEQSLRWDESGKEKSFTPMKMIHWLLKVAGRPSAVPVQSEYTTTYNARAAHSEYSLAISFKF